MDHALHNPVFNALLSGDAQRALGTGRVRFFDPEVSPFAGFEHNYKQGFSDLYDQLPPNRKIIYANPDEIQQPAGWEIIIHIPGLQFIYKGKRPILDKSIKLEPLSSANAAEMVALAALTKPGPFDLRTIEFGHYYGIFDDGKLVAMTGQRMHVDDYTEVSAVCTHPDHLGKGYAAALMNHQIDLILGHGQHAFLHTKADNDRAIALYHRLDFSVSRPMNFYFMKRRGQSTDLSPNK